MVNIFKILVPRSSGLMVADILGMTENFLQVGEGLSFSWAILKF